MRLLIALYLVIGILSPLYAVDKSTYTFNSGMNCQGVWRLPDTGQTASYTATFGEDHDYQPAAVQMSYTVNADNTVTDNVTGLVWRRCSQGQNDDATCTGAAAGYNWENALAQCENEAADGGNWRLPSVRELMSIVDYGKAAAPRINATYFPATVSGSYLTSTTYTPTSTASWQVLFDSGYVSNLTKGFSRYVRCVRGGPY